MFSTKNPSLITKEEKKEITVLDISNQDLGNSNSMDYQKQSKTLNLQEFENLQVFICSHNELEELIIDKISLAKLERLDCSYNKIKQIKLTGKADNLEKLIANANCLQDINFLSSFNPGKLIHLDFRNDVSKQNNNYSYGSHGYQFPLSSFSKFNKLEVLMIDRFSGSLINIRELTNLKRFSIRNSNITGDLEYLPQSLKLERFDYSGCPKIEEQLNPFKGQNDPLTAWRGQQRYYKLYQEIREKEVKPLQQKLTQEENNLKAEKGTSTNLQQQLENKKNELENNQKELKQCQNTLSSYQQFVDNYLRNKRTDLEESIQQAKNKLGESQDWLDSFFKAQKEISRNSDNSFAKEQSENAQNILNKKLTKEELCALLNKHQEIWQLEKQLVDLNIYEEKYEARIEVPAPKKY
ncbi:hypothetical protein [endosymbiont GvMRE of Glomus versiforme]|uniref:hypothetical protein n=1 Tax=endosymbiont GvMRE of Glomus versiforme TaxID=2039283 RepID=UPI000ED7FEB5|nr:hypothetical protein [endosymbiont GvMRE of Glomus versiforme]RHZ35837.1 Serine/threonine protein kinase [endosymbiont GvMRE of Glomus versiforme]